MAASRRQNRLLAAASTDRPASGRRHEAVYAAAVVERRLFDAVYAVYSWVFSRLLNNGLDVELLLSCCCCFGS